MRRGLSGWGEDPAACRAVPFLWAPGPEALQAALGLLVGTGCQEQAGRTGASVLR